MDILFVLSSLVALAGALLVVSQRNAVYALLGLLVSFGGTAGVFLSLEATFIAVSQILIYAGALAVLFLFVLMFTDTRNREASELPVAVGARKVFDPEAKLVEGKRVERWSVPVPLAAVISAGMLACFAFAIFKLPDNLYAEFGALPTKIVKGEEVVLFGSVKEIAEVIFEGYPLAFEVVSLLVFAAVLGAVLLARRHVAGFRSGEEPEASD